MPLPFRGSWRAGVVPVCLFVADGAVLGVDVEFAARFFRKVSRVGDGVAFGAKYACRSIGSRSADAPASTPVGHDVLLVSFNVCAVVRHMLSHLHYTSLLESHNSDRELEPGGLSCWGPEPVARPAGLPPRTASLAHDWTLDVEELIGAEVVAEGFPVEHRPDDFLVAVDLDDLGVCAAGVGVGDDDVAVG